MPAHRAARNLALILLPPAPRPVARAALAASLAAASAALAGVSATPVWTGEGNQANAHYGYSVSTAGDVNGDGYSDILVGARDYDAGQSNEGRALVYHGGPAGPSAAADWTAEPDVALAFFGQIAAPAGDVNGDGYGDVVVGAPNFPGTLTGEGRAFVYLGSAAGLAVSAAWTKDGGAQGATFGSGVATAGDVNGDGYDDLIVGARGWTGSFASEGRASVYLGGPGGPAATPVWTVTGGQDNAALGWSVGTAGDVNADGYADVIVGAFFWDGGLTDEGQARVYLGGPGGPALTPAWTAEGDNAGASFGWSVGTAGDVNGDGYADVIVGARFHTTTLLEEGRASVFLGSESGLSAAPAWLVEGGETKANLGWSVGTAGDVNGDGYADVIVGAYRADDVWMDAGRARIYAGSAAGLSLAPLWSAGGGQQGAQLGWSAGGAGDVDGDGFSDVIVGANFWDGGQSNEGAAFVYRGGGALPDTVPAWRGTAGGSAATYGAVVDWAGDVNGDGFSDLLVTDPVFSGGQAGEGRADLFLGGESGFDTSPDWTDEGQQVGASFGGAAARAGDLNGDGYDDFAVGAPLDDTAFPDAGRILVVAGSAAGPQGTPLAEIFGAGSSFYMGRSVAAAGDVNGDGFGDLIAGAYQQDGPTADAGAALLYLGSAGGIGRAGGGAGSGAVPAPGLSAAALTLTGAESFAQYGWSVSGAGDVNGDGFADVLIGEPGATDGESGEGRAWLHLGGPAGLDPFPAWSAQGDQPDARFGDCVASAGDVNGDGYADILVCASQYDGTFSDEGRAFLYLGGPGGPSVTADWTVDGGVDGASLGEARGAGDVDGDGFGDLIVGALHFTGSFALEGKVSLFLGSAAGPVKPPAMERRGGRAVAQLGARCAGPGDANGDGWGDLVLGAPGHSDSVAAGGAAFLLAGGGAGGGPAVAPRQLRADLAAPVALGGTSDSRTGFALGAWVRSPAGRSRAALEWEAKPAASPFGGPVTRGAWHDTGAPVPGLGSRVAVTESAGGLPSDTPARWRLRIRSASPWFAAGPWRSHPGAAPTESVLRTLAGPVAAPLPDPPRAAAPALTVAPNPFRRATYVAFDLPRPGRVRVTVHDVTGREVRVLDDGALPAGRHVRGWDGRDAEGRPVASGVYLIRAGLPEGAAAVRAVRLR
jgi:hypothetical protein